MDCWDSFSSDALHTFYRLLQRNKINNAILKKTTTIFAEMSSDMEPQISGKLRDDYHENSDINFLAFAV